MADWKSIFKKTELQFFQQPENKWIEVVNSTLDDLDENYAGKHAGHVMVLNTRLSLVPNLTEQDFDGSITVGALALNVIEPRISVPNLILPPVPAPPLMGIG